MSEKHKLWGGAFSESPDELAWRFGQSFDDDKNIWREEIEVSIAHAEMLRSTGVIPAADADRIIGALAELHVSDAWLENHADAEDIHAAVDAELHSRIGEASSQLTAARSRNDQIATVSRLWQARRLDELSQRAEILQRTLLSLGKQHAADPLLGTTHLQAAQPITLGYHLMAYFWMLQRDRERFHESKKNALEYCPLGSCALAGTTLNIDRDHTAKKLGFEKPSPSAIDSVSDRDFFGDALHALTQSAIHLSRISQELVLWATPQFGYVRLADSYSTGSSLMPQKRNPDMAELIRGRCAQVLGAYTAFQAMMHAQPLAYNRDMQDDKPGLYRAIAIVLNSLEIADGMLRTATFDLAKMATDANAAGATATDAAEQRVTQGMAFREAHEEVGRLVTSGQLEPISAAESIQTRKSQGGPAFEAFQAQLVAAEALLTPSV